MRPLPRDAGAEWMDDPHADPGQLAVSLADLRQLNRWLGGTRAVLARLERLMARHPREAYRVLDVATGSADIPVALAAWARRRGRVVRIVASDLHEATLEEARRRTAAVPEVAVERADALRLPYPDHSFDFVLMCTALHHFDGDDAGRALGELARVARIAVVVSDLRRSWGALLGAHLLAATLWRRHPITRHDGPLSVRRALTGPELRRLAQRAGLGRVRLHGLSFFRVLMVGEKAA